ncbi:MAG TPA: hypothetical protein VHO66_01745 [Ruminiclostridium sp.]|nr:hypothetical protein [Ruminiclostridium sp.]
MEIQHVEMDHINEQNSRTSVSALQGFAPHSDEGKSTGSKENQGDTYVMDGTRKFIRELCETGNVSQHIEEILDSGIEPDCLRAELACRAALGDIPGSKIIINYLAGNFKEALELTELLISDTQTEKLKEFLIFSDYFAGRYDNGCAQAKNCAALQYSPFLCYVYAEMLLSLGYIEQAREYTKKYVILARKYLNNFVSEKEKYDEQKKRREQNPRRKDQKSKENSKNSRQDKPARQESNEQNPALYEEFKELLSRRRVLITALKARNISIDKKPLMFELEDVDTKIAMINGKTNSSEI